METIFLKLLQCHGIKLKLIKLIRLRQVGGNQYQQLIFPYIIPPHPPTPPPLYHHHPSGGFPGQKKLAILSDSSLQHRLLTPLTL